MLNITNLSADYGGKPALKEINLTLDSGELLVVLGPSGCGKTTLLNLIAGFFPYQHGTIQLEGKKVEGPGAERGVVFQNEGLLPWRNVQENVAFGLQLAGVGREQRLATARAMLKKVGLEGAEKRFVWQLSGGQRQRVAIGRAIVRNPRVFMFDEPLSNLDAELRVEMRLHLARLHQELKTTMVYVTHDQIEAMTLADKIVVMNYGKVEQMGAPMELYYKPANKFVAGFIGSPKMNFLPATVEAWQPGELTVRLSQQKTLTLALTTTPLNAGSPVTLGIRPEHLTTDLRHGTRLTFNCEVVERLGNNTYLLVSATATTM